jgi:hypothetical protein
MKDLHYKRGQVFYKGKTVHPVQKIASIYEDDDGLVTVNFLGEGAGSYPNCSRIYRKQRVVRINNGYKCDEIKLK